MCQWEFVPTGRRQKYCGRKGCRKIAEARNEARREERVWKQIEELRKRKRNA